jgi:Ca2+-transporting ATPase
MGFNSVSALTALFKDLPKTINLIVVLVIVAIPEGLPLTIGVSLAFSVIRMYDNDKILVKNLQAPETMGEIEEICCGKTGTIT